MPSEFAAVHWHPAAPCISRNTAHEERRNAQASFVTQR
jgi:hypothetical protein